MKAILLFNKKVDTKKLYPRDVRNFVMSHTSSQDSADYLGNKTKKGHEQSEVVFAMPHSNGFEIINYTNNVHHMMALENDIVGKAMHIGNELVEIDRILWKEEQYQMPQRELCLYKTRTPIVLSINSTEHKIMHNLQKNKTVDVYLRGKIIDLTTLQMKQFFDYFPEMDDLEIKILECDHVTVSPHKHKGENSYFQAVYVTFISNYRLPRFIGYQTGLGYGEIVAKNFGN